MYSDRTGTSSCTGRSADILRSSSSSPATLLSATLRWAAGRTPQHQAHSRTVVDLDSRRAGHTISASAAEVASQLFFIFCYPVLKFPGQLRRTDLIGEEFIQFRFSLYSPDRRYMGKLRLVHIGIRTRRIIDQPSRKTFQRSRDPVLPPDMKTGTASSHIVRIRSLLLPQRSCDS